MSTVAPGRAGVTAANRKRAERTGPVTRPRDGLHPGAWWIWATGLAVAASRTTNPILLSLILAVTGYVAAVRAHTRLFGFFLRLATVVVALRMALAVIFTSGLPGHVVVALPQVPVPDFLVGLHIGGPVTVEALLNALYGALQFAALILAIGAAVAIADPRSLLRLLPAALYEMGVAVAVALSVAPELATAARRVRRARRLRGEPDRGLVSWVRSALPVLHGALERSINLAAAMDARGFGRRGSAPRWRRRLVTAGLVVGLLATAAASYALLTPGTPGGVGLPLAAGGALLAALAVLAGRADAVRTRYRPPRWTPASWIVAAAGCAAAAGVISAGHIDAAALNPTGYPPVLPATPGIAVAGILAAAIPVVIAHTTPDMRRTRARTGRPSREGK